MKNASAFSKALLLHLQWKAQLKKFLDGQGTFSVAELSPEECKFGKWLCSNEAAQYASDKELREIKRVHSKLHATAKRVYGQKMLGNDASARKELEKMEVNSTKLFSLMSNLKALSNT